MLYKDPCNIIYDGVVKIAKYGEKIMVFTDDSNVNAELQGKYFVLG